MSRLERPVQESVNPATKFLEWKSNEKQFSFYDKQTKENISVELPLKFLFLEHYHTVKGWSDSAESGIWSNEVFLTSKEPLTVKTKKGVLAEGLYKDIKPTVNNAGGKYHRSIYVMLENGYIANISLKGACIGGIKKEKAVSKQDEQGYTDFYNNNITKTDMHWIEVKEAVGGKSGSVKYSIPKFEIGERITEDDNKKADAAAKELQSYMDNYFSDTKEEPRENSEVDKYLDGDNATINEMADELEF